MSPIISSKQVKNNDKKKQKKKNIDMMSYCCFFALLIEITQSSTTDANSGLLLKIIWPWTSQDHSPLWQYEARVTLSSVYMLKSVQMYFKGLCELNFYKLY